MTLLRDAYIDILKSRTLGGVTLSTGYNFKTVETIHLLVNEYGSELLESIFTTIDPTIHPSKLTYVDFINAGADDKLAIKLVGLAYDIKQKEKLFNFYPSNSQTLKQVSNIPESLICTNYEISKNLLYFPAYIGHKHKVGDIVNILVYPDILKKGYISFISKESLVVKAKLEVEDQSLNSIQLIKPEYTLLKTYLFIDAPKLTSSLSVYIGTRNDLYNYSWELSYNGERSLTGVGLKNNILVNLDFTNRLFNIGTYKLKVLEYINNTTIRNVEHVWKPKFIVAELKCQL